MRAPAVGMMRNGAIISVRMMPFPKTSEFRRVATPRPMMTESAITATVSTTVLSKAVRKLSSVRSRA